MKVEAIQKVVDKLVNNSGGDSLLLFEWLREEGDSDVSNSFYLILGIHCIVR